MGCGYSGKPDQELVRKILASRSVLETSGLVLQRLGICLHAHPTRSLTMFD